MQKTEEHWIAKKLMVFVQWKNQNQNWWWNNKIICHDLDLIQIFGEETMDTIENEWVLRD